MTDRWQIDIRATASCTVTRLMRRNEQLHNAHYSTSTTPKYLLQFILNHGDDAHIVIMVLLIYRRCNITLRWFSVGRSSTPVASVFLLPFSADCYYYSSSPWCGASCCCLLLMRRLPLIAFHIVEQSLWFHLRLRQLICDGRTDWRRLLQLFVVCFAVNNPAVIMMMTMMSSMVA